MTYAESQRQGVLSQRWGHLDAEEEMHRKLLQNRKKNNPGINAEGGCLELVLRSREHVCRAECENHALALSSIT